MNQREKVGLPCSYHETWNALQNDATQSACVLAVGALTKKNAPHEMVFLGQVRRPPVQ